MKVLIGVYTSSVKQYCDMKFFTNLHKIAKGNDVLVIDNSTTTSYCNHLKTAFNYPNFTFIHLDIPVEPNTTVFHRRISESANYIRDHFLKGGYDSLVLVESDVIAPENTLTILQENIKTLPETWGALGGIYHEGHHDFKKNGIQNTRHTLCGCSIYNKRLIEKYAFRYSEENLGAFPDAYICHDSGHEFTFWDNHDIKCKHLPSNWAYTRQTE